MGRSALLRGGVQRRACPPRKGAAGERNVPPQNKPKTSRFIKYDNIFMIDPPRGKPR